MKDAGFHAASLKCQHDHALLTGLPLAAELSPGRFATRKKLVV